MRIPLRTVTETNPSNGLFTPVASTQGMAPNMGSGQLTGNYAGQLNTFLVASDAKKITETRTILANNYSQLAMGNTWFANIPTSQVNNSQIKSFRPPTGATCYLRTWLQLVSLDVNTIILANVQVNPVLVDTGGTVYTLGSSSQPFPDGTTFVRMGAFITVIWYNPTGGSVTIKPVYDLYGDLIVNYPT